MDDQTEFLSCHITTPSEDEANALALALVEAKLAACVNIIPTVQSVYRWHGVVEKARECLLIAKTRRSLFNALVSKVESMHSYEVPCIVALPIVQGTDSYFDWLRLATKEIT